MVVLEFSISFSRSYSFIPQRDHRGLKDNGVDRLGRAGQREHAGQDRRKGGAARARTVIILPAQSNCTSCIMKNSGQELGM